MTEISLIAFDADDTLWGSQTYFDTVKKVYCERSEERRVGKEC